MNWIGFERGIISRAGFGRQRQQCVPTEGSYIPRVVGQKPVIFKEIMFNGFQKEMSELVIRRYLSLFWLQFISLKK
ncbi:unnamed protein product [Medioppia subpectinata]|uniref:Uncharacterized protein n=1 Tax=Medioppia subpectinata TaxID=1979941 RepID=A0A7R9KVP3_9ACAR|nr:unnamed protein product [Medioppia subpectinata]CAG2110576.1 unnamed protein product [Medioppia subpectinata]